MLNLWVSSFMPRPAILHALFQETRLSRLSLRRSSKVTRNYETPVARAILRSTFQLKSRYEFGTFTDTYHGEGSCEKRTIVNFDGSKRDSGRLDSTTS